MFAIDCSNCRNISKGRLLGEMLFLAVSLKSFLKPEVFPGSMLLMVSVITKRNEAQRLPPITILFLFASKE
jgi:hypothetical protein